MAVQVGSQNEDGVQMLTSLAPSSKADGSLLRTPDQKSRMEKFSKNQVQRIYFKLKINSTTFDRMHLAKSKFDKVGIYLEEILSVFFFSPFSLSS